MAQPLIGIIQRGHQTRVVSCGRESGHREASDSRAREVPDCVRRECDIDLKESYGVRDR